MGSSPWQTHRWQRVALLRLRKTGAEAQRNAYEFPRVLPRPLVHLGGTAISIRGGSRILSHENEFWRCW